MVNISSDNVIAVKAKPGKIDVVKAALEARQENVKKQFEQYLVDQLDKAKKGKVLVKGDYAILLILGQDVDTFDSDIAAAEKIFNEAFE